MMSLGVLLHVYGERAPSEVRALPVFGVGVFGHTNHSLSPTEVEAAYRWVHDECVDEKNEWDDRTDTFDSFFNLSFF